MANARKCDVIGVLDTEIYKKVFKDQSVGVDKGVNHHLDIDNSNLGTFDKIIQVSDDSSQSFPSRFEAQREISLSKVNHQFPIGFQPNSPAHNNGHNLNLCEAAMSATIGDRRETLGDESEESAQKEARRSRELRKCLDISSTNEIDAIWVFVMNRRNKNREKIQKVKEKK